jgi:hypothetical protein
VSTPVQVWSFIGNTVRAWLSPLFTFIRLSPAA